MFLHGSFFFFHFYCWVVFDSMNMPHCVYPFTSWWIVDCFRFLSIMNEVPMNICITSLRNICYFSPRYVPRNEITRSNDNHMFNILWNCQIVFQSNCSILHYHKPCMRVLVSTHFLQHLVFSLFFIIINLVRIYLAVSHCMCVLLVALWTYN